MPLPPLVPRDVLFGNPERMNVRISPDGRRILYIAPDEGVLNVWMRSVAGGDDTVLTHDRHRGIHTALWTYDNDHICYLQDKDGDENYHLYAVNINTREVLDLTPFEGVQAYPIAIEPEHPEFVLAAVNKEEPQLHDVYKINITTGECELLVQNPGNIIGYDTDWRLNVIGGTAQREDGGSDICLYDALADEWNPILSAPFGESIGIFGILPDESGFYVSSSLDSNTVRVVTLDKETLEQKALASRDDVDFDGGSIIHPTKHHLQAVSFTRARQEWTFLESQFETDFNKASAIADGEFDLVNRDLDDKVWIVAFSSDTKPTRYYIFNRETGESEYLFTSRPDLDKFVLSPMNPVDIRTRDGLTMVCYLTLPEGIESKELPLVLNVHGGPWHRDNWGLDAEAQWLANRGYAVLQVNYRGSTGFGKEFVNAANREWAGKMHDDLLDAVQWAIEQGYADKEKVAIFGWSYGGYATMVGMTFTPDVFAVGVAGVGISNLVSWYNTIPPYWEPFREQINLRVGNANTEEEFLRSRSPLFKVDQIKNPLMIAQGANDPRVPQAESDQIVQAMKDRGIDVKYLLFEDEGHGFARPENRLEFYKEAEKFLAVVLGGRVEE